MNAPAAARALSIPRSAAGAAPLVEVRNLKKHFTVADGVLSRRSAAVVKAVDDVSFTIARGETLGLVGESGCGKTTTGRCILQLERATSGAVLFEGMSFHPAGSTLTVYLAIEGRDGTAREEAFTYTRAPLAGSAGNG